MKNAVHPGTVVEKEVYLGTVVEKDPGSAVEMNRLMTELNLSAKFRCVRDSGCLSTRKKNGNRTDFHYTVTSNSHRFDFAVCMFT